MNLHDTFAQIDDKKEKRLFTKEQIYSIEPVAYKVIVYNHN